MSVVALVAGLRERGVRLHLDQGRLKVGAPKGVLTDELLVQIRGHRDAITALLQEARDSDRATIPVRQVRSPCVLSHAQRRLWFIDQLEGANAVYSIPAALRLRGPLDVPALHAAIQDIVDRHETLRTTFRAVSGEPMQVIAEWQPVDLAVDDALEAELAGRLAAFASEPFDLAAGPLLRVRLLRLAPDEHVLLTNMHHIISDGWSINVMTAELAHFYRARVREERGSLPPLPIQYGDFAQWQQEHPSLPGQLAYWRAQLADLPPLLALPTDRPRPPLQGADGASHDFLVPPRVAEALRNLGQSRGATLFMTLLAAFKVVLARHANQDDIAVGTPIANRTRPELEGLIGFFVNTLVLRSRVAPEQSFEQLLDAVRSTALAAYEHQDLPFEQLVEALNPARSTSQAPLFQVMFSLQNEPAGEAGSLAGLELSLVGDVSSFAKFDLQLHLQEASAGIGGRLVYRTDLFDAATIARLAGHYRTLLEAVVAAPQARLSALDMVAPDERARLHEPYGERASIATDRCLPQLFEERAAATPDAPALRYEDQTLSYGELNRRANRLAHHLRTHGVGPERIVAVCLERSIELVVGLLAVLKAGGAYLPIDPACPPERLAYMLDDARPVVVLTQQSVRERVPQGDFALVSLDESDAALAAQPEDNPAQQTVPQQLAYIIYTSGSTGRPKGVQVEHRQVVRLFEASRGWFDFGPDEVWTLFHSCAFDFSVWEMWGALLHGGCLVVVPYWVSRSPEDYHALLLRERVTFLNQTPTAFRSLLRVDAQSPQRLSVRQVALGGEALDPASLRPWFARYGDHSRVVNMYGPTETTVAATFHRIAESELDAPRGSVIGRPLADLSVKVVDAHGHAAPLGVPGELWIGGPGVTRGYLRRPPLTAERFVAGDHEPGRRWYRSGDLVRRLPGGDLEYLGRIDQQVKIRGFRIELGEIEAALGELAGVREASVQVATLDGDDKRLVAYLVTAAPMDEGALRAGLRDRLPEYMVPAHFVRLDALPMTANGKLDRRALPPVDVANASHARYVEPATAVERSLAEVWARVLGREAPIGLHDNFFELGGHSLMVMRLTTGVRDALGHMLSPREIFAAPTLGAMARAIAGPSEPTWSPVVTVQPGAPDTAPLFVVHPIEGTVYFCAELARALGPRQAVHALQASGLESGQAPCDDLGRMAATYMASMRQVQPQGPYYLGGYSMGGTVALEVARQLRAAGEEVAFVGLLDAYPASIAAPRGRAELVAGLWGRALGFDVADIAGLDEEDCVSLVLEKGIANHVLPEGYGRQDALRQIRVLEANLRAYASHIPKPYAGEVALFAASDNATPLTACDWQHAVHGRVIVEKVPGDHFSMLAQPHVAVLAEALRKHLDRPAGQGDRNTQATAASA